MYLAGRLLSEAPQVLTTLLVFSLASGVLGGIFVYMDSAGPFVLAEMTDGMPLHMDVHCTDLYYQQSDITIEDIQNIITDQEGVASAEHIAVIDGEYKHVWRTYLNRFVYLGVSETFFETFSDAFEFSSLSQPLQVNGCYLEQTYFEAAGINIGDQYSITVISRVGDWFSDVEYVSIPFTVLGVFTSRGLWGNYGEGEEAVPILRAITMREDLKEKFGFLGNDTTNGVHDRIWCKFESTALGQTTPSEAVNSLLNIRRRIEQRTFPLAIVGQFPLTSIITEYATWNTNMISLALAFSIPSIVMGVVLVYYTSKLSSDKRRQDIGTLRVRGASTKQAFEWILSISLTTGILGGAGAILTGIMAAFLSGSSKGLFNFDFSQASEFSIFLQMPTLIFVFLFSFVLGIIVSIPSAVKNILMPASDAHKEIERDSDTQEEELSSPIIDVMAISISGFLATQLFLMLSGGLIGGTGWIFPLLIIGSFGSFIVFLTRFLARITAPLKNRIMDRIRNPSQIVGARVVGRTARLKIKSETLGVMFIAMVFTAAAFSAIAATSGINHINQLIQFQVGADIVADANTYGSNVTTDILEDIRAIDGVYDVSAVLVWGCMVYYQTIGPWSIIPNHRFVTLYGVQPTEWIDTAFFLPSFTKSYSPEKALSLLEENQNNILASFQPVIGYDIAPDSSYSYVYSDLLDVYIFGQESEDYLNLSIVDIMSSDENMNSQTFLPGFPDDEDFLIANIELLHEIIGVPLVSKLYVKLNPGVNHTRVVEEIWQSNPNSFVNIVSSQAEIDKIIGTRAGRSIYGVYTINVMFSLFYLTIGMCIVAMEKNRSFRKQFSVIRALGSQQRSVLGSMLIDSFLTMAMASIIGIFVGSLLSLLVLQTPLTYIGVSGSLDWLRLPITIVLPVETLSIILLLSFTIPLLATFVITRHSLNADLIDELRASF